MKNIGSKLCSVSVQELCGIIMVLKRNLLLQSSPFLISMLNFSLFLFYLLKTKHTVLIRII